MLLIPIVAVALAAWVIPALGVGALFPVIERNATPIINYRGRRIVAGLGIAWLLWGLAVIGMAALWIVLDSDADAWVLGLAGSVAIGAFIFGFIDDTYGDSSAKGFRGHLTALARGRLTTGGLKLIGIGGVAFGAALLLSFAYEPYREDVVRIVLATLTIGFFANLMNLFDLRPGRASKVFLAVFPILLAALVACEPLGIRERWALVASLPAPVFAAWRFDLGERGSWGDAGANAMGAVAGLVLAATMPTIGLAIVTVLLAALNIVSERYSFSKIIARSKLLTALDRIGRVD